MIIVIDRKKQNNASKQQWHMQLWICHHYLLLTSAIITELDSVFDVSKKSRRKSVFDQDLAWHVFASHHSICLELGRHLHMSFQSFQKLVGLLNDSLLVDQEMHECVTVLDGCHLQTTTPSKKQVHNVWSYFSGHYQTYGVNILAACDHNCHFSFIRVLLGQV